MKSMLLAAAVGVLFSCGSWFTPTRLAQAPAALPADGPREACYDTTTVLGLINDLEACERRVVVSEISVAPIAVPAPRVRERVVVKARQCADAGPVLQPIVTTKCMDGQLCMDEAAQLAYARNLMAYETWIKRVRACEAP